MYQDEDLDIEELLKINIKLTRENNKLLKKMHHARVLSFWGRILFYILMAGLAYYAYQYYLKDYVTQFQGMYSELQNGVDTVKDLPSRFGL